MFLKVLKRLIYKLSIIQLEMFGKRKTRISAISGDSFLAKISYYKAPLLILAHKVFGKKSHRILYAGLLLSKDFMNLFTYMRKSMIDSKSLAIFNIMLHYSLAKEADVL